MRWKTRSSYHDYDTLSIIVDNRESSAEKSRAMCSLPLCKPRRKRSNRAMNNARRYRVGNVLATSNYLKHQIVGRLTGRPKTSKVPSISTGSFDEYFLASV